MPSSAEGRKSFQDTVRILRTAQCLQSWDPRPRQLALLVQRHTVRTWYGWAKTHEPFPACLGFQLWRLKKRRCQVPGPSAGEHVGIPSEPVARPHQLNRHTALALGLRDCRIPERKETEGPTFSFTAPGLWPVPGARVLAGMAAKANEGLGGCGPGQKGEVRVKGWGHASPCSPGKAVTPWLCSALQGATISRVLWAAHPPWPITAAPPPGAQPGPPWLRLLPQMSLPRPSIP